MIQKLKKWKIPLSYKKLKIGFILSTLLFFLFGIFDSLEEGDIIWKIARDNSGKLGWYMLLFIIFTGLFSKIFPKIRIIKQILPLRKEAGILLFFIICFHVFFHLQRMGILGDPSQIISELFGTGWAILAGVVSFFIMIPLFLTSNAFSLKKLGIFSWKMLHKSTHIIFILVVLHISFIDYIQYDEISITEPLIFGIYLVGYAYLFCTKKKRFSD